jgi:threonine/homoserine efflux transporter RhtA
MKDSSRAQGGLICVAVAILGAWFLLALLQQSYWALAIPVAVIVCFALGLTFWVGYTIATIHGYTIATIHIEPLDETQPPETGDASAPPRDAPN